MMDPPIPMDSRDPPLPFRVPRRKKKSSAYYFDDDSEENEKEFCPSHCWTIVALACILLIILGVIVIRLDLFSLSHSGASNGQKEEEEKIGKSDDIGAIQTAQRYEEYINDTIDPCDDFYQFACGKWNSQPLPEGRWYYEQSKQLTQKIELQMKEALEDNSTISSQSPVENLKKFYRSCLSPDNSSKAMALEEIDRVVGLLRDSFSEGFSWGSLSQVAKENGIENGLFKIGLGRDPRSNERRVIEIKPPLLPFGNRLYQYDINFKNRVVLASIGPEADEVTELYLNISAQQTRDWEFPEFEVQKFREFAEEFNNKTGVDLLAYLRANRSQRVQNFLDQLDLDIVIYNPKYISKVPTVIHSLSPSAWLHHFYSLVYVKYIYFIGLESHSIRLRSVTFVLETPRWKYCLKKAETMIDAYDFFYVKHFLDLEGLDKAQDLFDYDTLAFYQIIEKSDWMDEETRNRAHSKLFDMESKIGLDEETLDEALLNQKYLSFDVDEEKTFFENYLALVGIEKLNDEEHFFSKKPYPRMEYDGEPMSSTSVNAFHVREHNRIEILPSYMQPPYFHKDYPMSRNFGGAGFTIAHEILHGFDELGMEYDSDGNYKNWWSKSARKNFKELARCFVGQYGAQPIEEGYTDSNGTVPLNDGIKTLAENIADNGGLRVAFLAYKLYQEAHESDKKIPSYDFSHEQDFFISSAQQFCSRFKPGSQVWVRAPDNHSSDKARINVLLQNTPEFSEAFSCPLGSPMNPEKKCKLW